MKYALYKEPNGEEIGSPNTFIVSTIVVLISVLIAIV